jgi:hypothetical protein
VALKAIVSRIHQQGGPEWAVWEDELRFQLSGPEWSVAYFRPMYDAGQLILGLLPQEGEELPKELYAYYHGRVIEMLLRHCSDLAGAVQVTTEPTYPDLKGWTGFRNEGFELIEEIFRSSPS